MHKYYCWALRLFILFQRVLQIIHNDGSFAISSSTKRIIFLAIFLLRFSGGELTVYGIFNSISSF